MRHRNFVARHMNTYNKPSVVPDKRSKHLDDQWEKEMDGFRNEDGYYEDDRSDQGGEE